MHFKVPKKPRRFEAATSSSVVTTVKALLRPPAREGAHLVSALMKRGGVGGGGLKGGWGR